MTFISVIICSHNPRNDYINEVMSALKAQTLPTDKWELLLIDNASDQPLADVIDISWHPDARHIREGQLGLVFARLIGIKEAKGELLVFVDDDNVLDNDYLEQALRISKKWPILGAWGGQARGQFEVPPPDWAKPFLGRLGILIFENDVWSNLIWSETIPFGAGMCIRRNVADAYREKALNNPLYKMLGRRGNALFSGEDGAMAMTSCYMGLGTGRFVCLKLTHLIPAKRLTEEYFIKLFEAMEFSYWVLQTCNGNPPPRRSFARKLIDIIKWVKLDVINKQIFFAKQRGYRKAANLLRNL